MHLELDGTGPRYLQLTRALRAAIETGRLAAGAPLPPSRRLAEQLGVSRNTVISAYEQLRAEGLLDAHAGSATFVNGVARNAATAPPVRRKIEPQSRYSERARRYRDFFITRRHYGLRYNFQYGEPITNPSLYTTWSRELKRAADYCSPDYPDPQGLPELRAAVCDYLARRRGIQTEPDHILIVSGSQQACYLTSRVLLDEGDRVVLEEPNYFGLRQLLQAHGAELLPIPADARGLCCDLLPAAPAKLICVTPSHQFPCGAALSLERRHNLLRYAARSRGWILEDDYDSEFRYTGQPLPALKSLDRDERIIYTGTFSKVLFPSLRLGYMVLPRALRRDFLTAKWLCDFGSPAIEQRALAGFIRSGGFERHLGKALRALRARRNSLIQALHQHLAGKIEIEDSQAGMHLVVWLRGYTAAQCEALIERGRQLQVGLYAIAPHYMAPPERQGLLLGFSGLSPAEIRAAVLRLKRAAAEVDGS